jgi:hypothetical protein
VRTFVVASLVSLGVAWAPAARADDEGSACTITADCSEGLRCIEGACVSVSGSRIVAPVVVRHERSASDRAWTGDGNGYVLQVVGGDVAATAVAGLLVGVALGTGQGWFAFAAVFPTTLTAPIIHAANGRGGPAAISFFAWAAVPPTLTFFAALLAFATFGQGNNTTAFAVGGYTLGIGCAIGLTSLDAYFARNVHIHRRVEPVSIVPAVTPTQHGFTAGIAGSF